MTGVLDATIRGGQPVPLDLRQAHLLLRRALPDLPRGKPRLEASDSGAMAILRNLLCIVS